MKIILDLRDTVGPLRAKNFTWKLSSNDNGSDPAAQGQADTDQDGKTTLDIAGDFKAGDYFLVECGDLKGRRKLIVIKQTNNVTVTLESDVKIDPTANQFDIKDNDLSNWDWLVWETEGNSDPKYQRGGRERKLGLYRLNYDLLRKAGDPGKDQWEPCHTDGTLGGGSVKIAVLDELDYSSHGALLDTFLPCFKLKGKKPAEPEEREEKKFDVCVSRSDPGTTAYNTLNVRPPYIVMPFNYDDNSPNSKAIGKDLGADLMTKNKAGRLLLELPRWSSASRSTIASFSKGKCDLTLHKKNKWDLRPHTTDDPTLPQVKGDSTARTFSKFQNEGGNSDKHYYSVKTGVNFVATQDQGINGKDLLESNSIHAMSRSNLIAGVGKTKSFQAEYQIEILSVLFGSGSSWDGIQIREIGTAGNNEVWFPALTIPSHGKAFAEAWSPGCNWVKFWEDNFARPVGRAKAEMLVCFGLQHMTSNAQNFLVSFDRSKGSAGKKVILRDIGDTLLNNVFFDVLKAGGNSELFTKTWNAEVADAENGIVLEFEETKPTIGGGYANPQITRIGTGIIFFFPPFLKGDLDTGKSPANAKIAARWGVAHNEGFLEYMKEKLGYKDDWDRNSKDDKLKADVSGPVRKFADLSISGKSSEYPKLAAGVLQLPSGSRRELIAELKQEINDLDAKTSRNVTELQNLVAGHELLICAEIHSFIQSAGGKDALLAI